jgi:hypothetical protein
MVYTQHTRVALSVAGSNYSNQLQLIATDTNNTFNIASPPDSNGASSLTFCKHPHYLIRLIGFELFCNIHFAAFISSRNWNHSLYKALPRVNWIAITRRQASNSKRSTWRTIFPLEATRHENPDTGTFIHQGNKTEVMDMESAVPATETPIESHLSEVADDVSSNGSENLLGGNYRRLPVPP